MSEVSLAAARAAVMVYDDANKKWIPSGSSSGLSKVHVYHHTINNTFRVVGRKLHDHEVVINCALLKGLKYNQATPTFHQWRDNKQVYGLNFSSKDDADAFASAMLRAIEVINGHMHRPAPAPPAPSIPQISSSNQYANQNNHQQQQQNVYQSVNNGYEEDTYRSRDDSAPNTMERRSSQNSLGALNHSVSTPTMQQPPQPMMSPSQSGHHRAASAPNPPQAMSSVPQPPPVPPGAPPNTTQGPPPPPPAPPQFGISPMAPPAQFANTGGSSPPVTSGPPAPPLGGPPAPPPMPTGPPVSSGPPAPPPMGIGVPPAPPSMNSAPPAPPVMSGGPPPPPPMMPLLSRQNSGMEPNSLVNALQNVRLKKSSKSIDSGASSSSSSSAGSTYGTIGKGASERPSLSGAGIGSMMDEMQRTLARRRAQAERQDTGPSIMQQDENDRKYNTIATTNGRLNNGNAESPKSGRKRLGSSGDESSPRVNGKPDGGSLDLESLKQEIIKEVRKDIQKAKQEIIDAIRIELSRR